MISGIVLAAGMGRRIGTPKALLALGGDTLHERALRLLLGLSLDVVVVVNPSVNDVLPSPGPRERRVINPDPEQAAGMFSSVRLGIAEAQSAGATAAVLLPVDHPMVAPGDVARVIEGLRSGAAIVVPTHQGRRGHPVGLSAEVMVEVLADLAATTLRDIVRRNPARVLEVEASEGVLIGINTREDLARVSNRAFR